MKRISALSTVALFALAACGGDSQTSEQAPAGEAETPAAETAAAPAGELSLPGWFQMDAASRTVTLNITAGATSDNQYWNYNGYYGGTGTIVVPEGYLVTINFTNDDPAMAHSLGVDARTGGFPASFSDPTPVFEGGITTNPTSLTEATLPGESETISFTAATAGEYSLVCYIAGHALTGMHIGFTVSAEGEAGFRS
jgi:FtsP/CotA-like multicopper oxidase with cupredoxin domain